MLLWLSRRLQTRLDHSCTGGRFAAHLAGALKRSLRTTSQSTWMDLYLSFMTVRLMQTDDCIWVTVLRFRTGWTTLITIRSRSQQDYKGYDQPIQRPSREGSPVSTFLRPGYNLKLTPWKSYVPGWDCHGLPIENKALAALGVRPLVK